VVGCGFMKLKLSLKKAHKRTEIQSNSNMTGTNCDLFTHKQSRSYLKHLV
jgi:hypothetical protein